MAESIETNVLLTNFATRFKDRFDVAEWIAPSFKVKRSSDKYSEYDKSSQRHYDNKISGRELAKEISQDVTTSNYSTEEYALSRFVSDRKARNADKPINLLFDATKHVKAAQMRSREKRVFDIAGDNSVITQTANAGGDWDDKTNGDPVGDILTGIRTIWDKGQEKANRIVVPMNVAIEAIKTDAWRDWFKFVSVEKQFDFLAGLRNVGLDSMMAGMFGGNTQQGGASDPGSEQIWSDSVLIFYAEPTPTLDTRTLMYSPFVQKNIIRRIRKDEERGLKIEIYEEIDELLVDRTLGYLITNTL